MNRIATNVIVLVLLSAGTAQASVRCSVPMTEWQPRDAVTELAARNGWDVRRIKIDDGCYEIYATDINGRPFEVKVSPDTLEVIEVEYEDEDDDDDERGHDGRRNDHDD
jgi:hypothetical protein